MKSCVFFGHRHLYVQQYRDKLLEIITDLIENKDVTQFYSGYRGNFDCYCSFLISELKDRYPHIRNTLFLSYIPVLSENSQYVFKVPECFDDSIYLLERRIPQRHAIIETNKCIVDKADYIVAGVKTHSGGAYTACEYAHKRKKPIISVIDGWEI